LDIVCVFVQQSQKKKKSVSGARRRGRRAVVIWLGEVTRDEARVLITYLFVEQTASIHLECMEVYEECHN